MSLVATFKLRIVNLLVIAAATLVEMVVAMHIIAERAHHPC